MSNSSTVFKQQRTQAHDLVDSLFDTLEQQLEKVQSELDDLEHHAQTKADNLCSHESCLQRMNEIAGSIK
jgi:hypothetical protein